MSAEPPRCIYCQEPLDIHRLEEPGIRIKHYTEVIPPDDYYNLQITTIMQCQSCRKDNHILWNMNKVLSTEGVQE